MCQPLSPEEKSGIAELYRHLQSHLPGFTVRTQQKEMIGCIAGALANETPCLIEAPTGTGKSFGYQVPGALLALKRGKRLVISTQTVTLQEQIAKMDLPVLLRALESMGMSAQVSIVKGRERFVCPMRLTEKTSQSSLLQEDNEQEKILDQLAGLAGGDWNGQRDALSFRVPDRVWHMVCNNRHVCPKTRCPMENVCPHVAMKNQAKQAQIIVTNHAYLLSVIAAQGGSNGKDPITDFANNYYIFDEAHHLQSRFLDAFAQTATLDEGLLAEAEHIVGAMASFRLKEFNQAEGHLAQVVPAIQRNLHQLLGASDTRRFSGGVIPEVLADQLTEYMRNIEVIAGILDDILTRERDESAQRASLVALLNNARVVHGNLVERIEALHAFVNDDTGKLAKWIGRSNGEISLNATPFNASALAQKMLWNNMKSVVLTSATLASMGNFNNVMHMLGLPDETITMKLDSPLDFSRSRLMVPKLIVDANTPGHARMVTFVLRKLAFSEEHVGVLAYFTSRAKMEEVYEALGEEEKECVIKQGDYLPAAMIDEHKKRIDAGRRSILFGLNSLSEGIDLPGRYCSLVLIDKIPFPVPEDPILAAMAEYLTSLGKSPFHLIYLPEAAKRLAQAAGRLNRREDDWGSVVIMDKRILEKNYGAQLVKSMPFSGITAF